MKMFRTITAPERRKMCCGIILITALIATTRPVHATPHSLQDPILERLITLNFTDLIFEKALVEIEQAASIRFFYSAEQLNVRDKISLHVTNVTLGEVLDQIFKPHGIQYRVHAKEASILLKRNAASPHNQSDITPATQPVRTMQITGIVRDQKNQQAMPGVSVLEKNTMNGTATDADGSFSILAAEDATLVFSFIGFVTQEVRVNGKVILEVMLVEDTKTLDAVVVNAGYWQVNKREHTGNISKVSADDLEKQPVSNPLMGLAGRMAGVVVQQVSGVPGAGIRLQIRGQNSLRNSNTDNGNLPLYVIDGVPLESASVQSTGALFSIGGIDPLNTINPANIESIEILKDADATAIYGSRGANGVVLITTKKGTQGKMQLDIQAYGSVGKSSSTVPLLNTQQYLNMRNEAFQLDGTVPAVGDYDLNGTWSPATNTDWQKELYGGTATIQDIQTAISGGNASTAFRAGIGMHRETTVFPGDFGYRKVMGNLNVNHASIDKKFKLSLTINYGMDNNELFNRNIVQDALILPPNAPGKMEDGSLDWTGYTTSRPNPFSYFKITHLLKSDNLITNSRISYELFKGLTTTVNVGFTDGTTSQLIKTPQASMNPDQLAESKSTKLDLFSKTWIAEPQLGYTREIFSGKLDVLIGATWQDTRTENFGIEGTGFISDALLGNVRSARTVVVFRDDKTVYRYNAVFGRIAYNWKDRYIVNLTARRDGSSRFGPNNKFGNFAAIGAGWIFSEEDFLKNNLPVISFGKIRASYGTTGSDRIGNYGYFSTYSPTGTTYGNTPILSSTALSNPQFGWEVNKKLEAAIDLGFFQDRLVFSFSAYRNRSSNQLVGYPLPTTTGFTSVQYNLEATVQNSGVEMELGSTWIRNAKWQWHSGLNVTLPRNKLVSYPGIAASTYATTYVVGEPLTINKRFQSTGIDPLTGQYTVLDADQNGSITTADRIAIVDMGRRLFGGLTNRISYQGFELDFLLEFVNQNSSGYMNLFQSAPGTMNNQPELILEMDRWKQEGDEAHIQRFSQNTGLAYSRMLGSNANVADASFIRLKTIALTWSLPQHIAQTCNLADARIYVQGQNLFTLTPYEGLNPEFVSTQLPPLRTLTLGLLLKF